MPCSHKPPLIATWPLLIMGRKLISVQVWAGWNENKKPRLYQHPSGQPISQRNLQLCKGLFQTLITYYSTVAPEALVICISTSFRLSMVPKGSLVGNHISMVPKDLSASQNVLSNIYISLMLIRITSDFFTHNSPVVTTTITFPSPN